MKTITPITARSGVDAARCGAANAWRIAALAGLAMGMTGCAGMRPVETSPPPVQLVSSGELNLPRECVVASGAVYRTLFEVQPDGRVAAPRSAEPAGDDGCVQQALREWVATFRYAPIDAPTPVAFDWMVVTASRHQ